MSFGVWVIFILKWNTNSAFAIFFQMYNFGFLVYVKVFE